MHKIVFTRRALKDLEKIPKDEKNRIGEKLKEYTQEPMKYARKLTSVAIGRALQPFPRPKRSGRLSPYCAFQLG